MESDDLLTYCGIYGGSCARYEGYKAFRTAANIVAEIVDSHGFQYWMPQQVKEFNYTEFRKGLEFFRNENTWLVCPECCRGGGGAHPIVHVIAALNEELMFASNVKSSPATRSKKMSRC